jgi:hypothetical protein
MNNPIYFVYSKKGRFNLDIADRKSYICKKTAPLKREHPHEP